MHPPSPPEPDSSKPNSSTSSQLKSPILSMFSPVILWSSLVPRGRSVQNSCRQTVQDFSIRVSDGFRNFTGEMTQEIDRLATWAQPHDPAPVPLHSQAQAQSIGSRGYDEFQKDQVAETRTGSSISTSSVSGSVYTFD